MSIRSQVGATLLLVMILGLSFFLIIAGAVSSGRSSELDRMLLDLVYQRNASWLDLPLRFASHLGSMYWIAPALGALGIYALVRGKRWPLLVVAAAGGAALLNFLLKLIFARERPEIYLARGYGFPSGHAMISFCFYSALALGLAAKLRNRLLPLLLFAATALLLVAIGISRLYLGAHYPTDVIAGYAAGLVWLSLVYLMFKQRSNMRS